MVSAVGKAAELPRLRVLTYNIHHAEGTDGRVDYERLGAMINGLKPDVVAVQEVDEGARRTEGVFQSKRLAELTGMNSVFGAAMPFSGGHYGVAILSRFPIESHSNHPLPFQFGQEPRTALKARILPDNGIPPFDFVSTHFCHQSESNRVDQAKQLRRFVRAPDSVPVIVAGDFNARPNSAPMMTFLADDWLDATAPQSVIDYVLVRSDDPWRLTDVETIEDRVISDHRPVIVELEWVGGRGRSYNETPDSLEALEDLQERLQGAIYEVEDAIVAINDGTGGGVLVSEDGYVLTAAHVSGYGRRVRVKLADGRDYTGRSLGAYRFADAAMVKIDDDGPFPFVPVAPAGQAQVGEWCFALGHPGGLDPDRGIVARIGRVISKKENLLRSDCRILGGDSGCALFNLHGELIGIHSRIGRPLDQNYHAPSEAFLTHWDEMKDGVVLPPRVRRSGGLGVNTVDANPGVRIVRVVGEDSPLQKGDVIRQFDDYLIEDDWEYVVALSSRRVGDTVRLRVLREDEWLDIETAVTEIEQE